MNAVASWPRFSEASRSLGRVCPRQEILWQKIVPAPQAAEKTLAFKALALDPVTGGQLASGNFCWLEESQPVPGWRGRVRCVGFWQAPLEDDLAADPLLEEVLWAWLMDSLGEALAEFIHPAATASRLRSLGFGDLARRGRRSCVQLRASWSPRSEAADHARAFLGALARLAGLAPVEGVPQLHRNVS